MRHVQKFGRKFSPGQDQRKTQGGLGEMKSGKESHVISLEEPMLGRKNIPILF